MTVGDLYLQLAELIRTGNADMRICVDKVSFQHAMYSEKSGLTVIEAYEAFQQGIERGPVAACGVHHAAIARYKGDGQETVLMIHGGFSDV